MNRKDYTRVEFSDYKFDLSQFWIDLSSIHFKKSGKLTSLPQPVKQWIDQLFISLILGIELALSIYEKSFKYSQLWLQRNIWSNKKKVSDDGCTQILEYIFFYVISVHTYTIDLLDTHRGHLYKNH